MTCINTTSSGSYLESTSGVKNNCKGQSTKYSRAIPSQPSRLISDEAFDCAVPEFPSVFGTSNCEDFIAIPNEGILVDTERERQIRSLLMNTEMK